MCIDVPGRVIAVDELGAVVETARHRRRASTLLLPDIAVGDYVTVAAGTIVVRLTPAEAADILELLDRASAPPSPGSVGPTTPLVVDRPVEQVLPGRS